MELMRGGSNLATFDGTKPEDFWSWYEEFQSNISRAGLHEFPREVILALRTHTAKRPREVVVSYIERGIGSDAQRALDAIWNQLIERYGSDDVVASSLRNKLANFRNISCENDAGAIERMEDLHTLCLRI